MAQTPISHCRKKQVTEIQSDAGASSSNNSVTWLADALWPPNALNNKHSRNAICTIVMCRASGDTGRFHRMLVIEVAHRGPVVVALVSSKLLFDFIASLLVGP
jgi:hypothetical protein